MWFIGLLGFLVTTNAIELLSRRSLTELDEGNMNTFSEVFHTTLMHIIGTEWEETNPLVDGLKADMLVCQTSMEARKTACENCAKGACSPSSGEAIEHMFKGLGNEIKDFFDDDGNKFVSWQGWDDMKGLFEGIGKKFVGFEGWKNMGDFFENLGKGFVGWSGWNDMVKFFNGFLDFGESIGKGFSDFGKGFVDVGEDIGKGFSSIGKDIGKGFSSIGKDIGKGLSSIGKDIGKGFSSWLGRRRRSVLQSPYGLDMVYPSRRQITPEVRECMENCAECDPFLAPADQMVGMVCGKDLVELNRTVQLLVHNLELLYNRMVEEKKPAVTALKYETTSLVGLAFQEVRLTCYFEEGVLEYNSNIPYELMAVSKTAALMAREYYERFVS